MLIDRSGRCLRLCSEPRNLVFESEPIARAVGLILDR